MRNRVATTLIAVILTALVGAAAFGVEQGVIDSVSGTVRIHQADGSWELAEVGDLVEDGMALSTGFDASAVVALGASRITVDPIAYVQFSELAQDGTEDRATMDLSFGRVRSRVRDTEGRSTDFEVRSPVSTATVKGTDFLYDGSRLEVLEGDVALQNSIGQSHSVRAGQRSRAYGYEGIESVETYFAEVVELR